MSDKPYWEGKKYAFFQHRECEFFPCHPVADDSKFNCLFCYCPLYALGDRCGGNCAYTEAGVKDCSGCLIPHSPAGYDYINGKFGELARLARANCREPESGSSI